MALISGQSGRWSGAGEADSSPSVNLAGTSRLGGVLPFLSSTRDFEEVRYLVFALGVGGVSSSEGTVADL